MGTGKESSVKGDLTTLLLLRFFFSPEIVCYKNRQQLSSTFFIPYIGKQNYTQNQLIPLAVTKILTTWPIVNIFSSTF